MTVKTRGMVIGLLAILCLPWSAMAQGAAYKNWHVQNRLRLEYDDNVFTTQDNRIQSWKVIEQIDLSYNLSMENTFLSLRWRPGFVFWENRPGDDSTFDNASDLSFNHVFNPRWSVSLQDTFRFTQNPEQNDRGTTLRQQNEFIYNTLLGAVSYLVTTKTRLELAGRWVTLQYDEDEVARHNDYDLYVGGLTLRHAWKPQTAFSADVRCEALEYQISERDSDTISVGVGAEHTFNPGFLGSAHAGYQNRDFKGRSVTQNDSTSPTADLTLTYLPAPATRLSTGASYSLFESDIFPYSSTDRGRVFLSAGHDFTAKVSGFLTVSYTRNEYNGNEAVGSDLEPIRDGEEDWYQASARMSYKLNRRNSLELNWQYTDVDSDVRESFKKQRGGIGWVLKI